MGHTSELIIGIGDFKGHVGRSIDGGLAKEIKREGCH